jgi:aerobic-type carbon monoxide dehydrogenase small subunit (CoxS/CutS family)
MQIRCWVNGAPVALEIGCEPHQVEPSHTLAHTLRETLGLVGTKVTCDNGACGSSANLVLPSRPSIART